METTTTSPRFPAYNGEFDDDDFGPEPDPSTYRTAPTLDESRAAARAELAGRRTIAEANLGAGCATTSDMTFLAEHPAPEAVNADGSSIALFGADCATCGAGRCMGRLICGCDDDEMATGPRRELSDAEQAELNAWLNPCCGDALCVCAAEVTAA